MQTRKSSLQYMLTVNCIGLHILSLAFWSELVRQQVAGTDPRPPVCQTTVKYLSCSQLQKLWTQYWCLKQLSLSLPLNYIHFGNKTRVIDQSHNRVSKCICCELQELHSAVTVPTLCSSSFPEVRNAFYRDLSNKVSQSRSTLKFSEFVLILLWSITGKVLAYRVCHYHIGE